ncbi:MAG: YgiQ family radical SAM protein, partial [Desulfobacteraceae bacterium]|nr:YgiQ family radical SAM protein [Desulfobacteraceae bacterium]
MFLPTTPNELKKLKIKQLDIILVTGDAYIDSPFMGVSLLGKVLVDKGYKVGIIGQPDIENADDISRLGQPRLFWGITAGAVDSMVANYTASKKRRQKDDYTPGGINNC